MCREIEELVLERCGGRPTQGNRVTLLNDGSEMYAALIAALHRARHSILMEYYAFDDDRIGRAISDLLIRKARNGVRVLFIYDLVGSWMPPHGVLRRLKRAGVEVRPFRSFDIMHPLDSLRVRNHRKVTIIDCRVAFVGGINIARRYLEGNELGRWRDEHLSLEGEVVAELYDLFRRDWLHVGGRWPREIQPLRHVATERDLAVQLIRSQAGPTRRHIEQALLSLLDGARREVLLTTPYFVPTPPLLEAMCRAAERGVRVRLMLPARGDLRVVAWAAEEPVRRLLHAGGEVLQYEGGFLHTKMAVADSRVALLGTANLDYRSLRTNWEVATLIFDEAFARLAAETFTRDEAHCRRLTLPESSRWYKKIRTGMVRIIARAL